MALSNVYSSKNPKISGRDSGRTVKKKNAIMKDGIIMIMDKKSAVAVVVVTLKLFFAFLGTETRRQLGIEQHNSCNKCEQTQIT